ncbi:MAG: SCO2521 family protein [Streptosporangiaceae bacterium]
MFSATESEGALTIGVVKTGFLGHSTAVSPETASALLALVPGEQVRHAHRPRAYAVSPEPLTGVDCEMPSLSGRRTRGVGTVATRATLTGGRILQSCSYTTLVPATRDYRREWSHYLGRPGVVEVIRRMNAEDAAAGFAESDRGARAIELELIADAVLTGVQISSLLDRKLPLRAERGAWRWAFQHPGPDEAGIFKFTILRDGTRLLRLGVSDASLPDLLDLVEDLALHDWLLRTVEAKLERVQLESGTIDRALPSISALFDHLIHHWMPCARVKQELLPLWNELDRAIGLTQPWEISVNRVRDQLRLRGMNHARGPAAGTS